MGVPLALLDVLGRPVLERVTARLRSFGIASITVVGSAGSLARKYLPRALRDDLQWVCAPGPALWRAAQEVFAHEVLAGAESLVVTQIGSYCETDYAALLQRHLEGNRRVTALVDAAGQFLETFVVGGARRNDAAYLLRHELRQSRTPWCVVRMPATAGHWPISPTCGGWRWDGLGGRARVEPGLGDRFARESRSATERSHCAGRPLAGPGVRRGICAGATGRRPYPLCRGRAPRGRRLRHGGGGCHIVALYHRGCRVWILRIP